MAILDDEHTVIIYTDGACDPNPGPGGYGVVILDDGSRSLHSQGYRLTTNNRMELMGPIAALRALGHGRRARVVCDSRYVVDGVNQGWARKWRAANWVGKAGKRVPNHDLWQQLLDLLDLHNVEFEWTRGHASDSLNILADTLSYRAIEAEDPIEDEGYRNMQNDQPRRSGKITAVGQPCRKCGARVVKKRPMRRPNADQQFYFEYYLYCPSCNTNYMVESAKRPVAEFPPSGK